MNVVDLFSGAGGAARGYVLARHEVLGVEINGELRADLTRFREVIDAAEADLRRAVIGQRATGASWAEIGQGLSPLQCPSGAAEPRPVALPPSGMSLTGVIAS